MRHRLFILVAAAAMLLIPHDAAAKHRSAKPHTRSHRTKHKSHGAWDPGYTYNNPYGLPRWARKPSR